MFSLNDSANLPPAPVPTFADLTTGTVFRDEANQYLRKISSSAAYDYVANATVAVASDEHCVEVDATLVIS